MKQPNIAKLIASWFFQGLLVIVPLALLGYVVYALFTFLDQLIPFQIPGLGILTLLVIITLLGFLGSTIVARPVKWWFEEMLNRVPPLKSLYEAVSDLMSALVGNKKRFDKPVLVKFHADSDLYKLGYLTQSDLTKLGIPKGMVAVYLPHSYNFSGNLFIVPAAHVTPLDSKSMDVMKFIVSGGVTELADPETDVQEQP